MIKKGPVGLGTGPGIFVKFVSNDYVEFKRNPNYWRKDVPKWDKLVFRIVPEDAVRVAYLLTNQAQVITAPPKRICQAKDFENINGATKPSYGFMMLTMNLNAAPMDDMNFRFAVSRAINREEIAKLFGGIFYSSRGFYICRNAPGRPFNMEAEKALNYNLESAKEYLSKSKYPNGTDFELVSPGGSIYCQCK